MMTRYANPDLITRDELQPGDRVLLVWNGYSGVPKHLHHTWATVVGVGRSRAAVNADAEASGSDWPQRYARFDQILEHKRPAPAPRPAVREELPTASGDRIQILQHPAHPEVTVLTVWRAGMGVAATLNPAEVRQLQQILTAL